MSTPHTAAEAHRLLAAGRSIIPIKPDGSKAPPVKWARYQTGQADGRTVDEWVRKFWLNGFGIALVTGFDGVEVLDFDFMKPARERPNLWNEFVEFAEAIGLLPLVKRCPTWKTPTGGQALAYRRTDGVPRNDGTLARIPTINEKGEPTSAALIETRGQGGYALIPPSPPACHDAGYPYVMLYGELADIPTLTPREVSDLRCLCRWFDEYQQEPTALRDRTAEQREHVDGTKRLGRRPGDDYNARGDHIGLLKRHGWTIARERGGIVYLSKPNASHPGDTHSTWNYAGRRKFYCFSTNATPIAAGDCLNGFALYAKLECGGDFAEATRRLAAEGFGERLRPTKTYVEHYDAVSEHDDRGDDSVVNGILDTERQLQRIGIRMDGCVPIIPEGIDREDFEAVGFLLREAEGRVNVLVRLRWAAWYASMPNERGVKGYILLRLFGDNWSNKQKDLAEWTRVYKRIPARFWRPDRRWSFFDLVSKLETEERRVHWLEMAPYKGMYSGVEAEIEAERATSILSSADEVGSACVDSPGPKLRGDLRIPGTQFDSCLARLRERVVTRPELAVEEGHCMLDEELIRSLYPSEAPNM